MRAFILPFLLVDPEETIFNTVAPIRRRIVLHLLIKMTSPVPAMLVLYEKAELVLAVLRRSKLNFRMYQSSFTRARLLRVVNSRLMPKA
jgi:hypothetical protein